MDLGQLREEVEPLALKLLLKETPEDQQRLLAQADHELMAWGIDAHFHLNRGSPNQWVSDLVEAPGLSLVASNMSVSLESVLAAETFRDLLDQLIPAVPSE